MSMHNPFAELAAFLPAAFMPSYIILMVLLVVAGTLYEMVHKGNAEFFTQAWRKKRALATRRVGFVETVALAIGTLLREVAVSGEFDNPWRRISHLLMFYGFLAYLVSTVTLVFRYAAPDTPPPAIWPLLWNLGAIMVLTGGLWFFFFLRVDVAKEGKSPWRLMRADLFVVSLLGSVASGLAWELVQLTGHRLTTQVAFWIYLFFTTVLFAGVPWSKFAHMFYKPVAAFQKRVEEANGSTSLPPPSRVNNIVR